jgi:hypothetical protein
MKRRTRKDEIEKRERIDNSINENVRVQHRPNKNTQVDQNRIVYGPFSDSKR